LEFQREYSDVINCFDQMISSAEVKTCMVMTDRGRKLFFTLVSKNAEFKVDFKNIN
jgi:hypothetical protein